MDVSISLLERACDKHDEQRKLTSSIRAVYRSLYEMEKQRVVPVYLLQRLCGLHENMQEVVVMEALHQGCICN